MKTDLLIIWAWEHDADFLDLLKATCVARGISVRMLGAKELPGLREALQAGHIQARVLIDRVWDWGGEYARHCDAVQQQVQSRTLTLLNDYSLVRRAWNKPTMHYEIIAHGLSAPYMIVLPSYESQPFVGRVDLTPLGACFSVKGAHSGGSGVLRPICSWDEVTQL
ncbi:MAG: hypothetical protein M1546_00480, partial [Chloroflexi bacterium]|nr:hypothetical protein [Chloroflexota bacterium]